ncbi:MAG: LPS-assembly lipoprotein [Gammaproteobacteria bacterium]|jgi:LPS-assembly lipoprotein
MKTQYLIIILLFTLSACGFHLRGSQQSLSMAISEVYVSNTHANEVTNEVRLQLVGSGVKVVESKEMAKFALKLDKESFDRTVLSVSGRTGKVEEYQLTFTVNMSVIDDSGNELLSDEQIYLTREYTFDENAVLSKFGEEQLLRDELVSEAATQIVRRLDVETRSK